MPQRVHLPDGRIVNFPDSMTPQAIQSAMVQLSGRPSQTPPPATGDPAVQAQPTETRAARVMRTGMQPMWSEYGSREDVVAGLTSSAANLVYQGGDVIRRGWNAVMPESMDVERVIERPEVQAAITAPQTIAGKVGRFAGDTAQLVIPAGRVATMTKGARQATRMAAQGATGSAVTGAQTGGDIGDMVTSGLLMGAAPAVAQAASALGAGLTERLPERLYTQIFKAAHDDVAQAMRAEARGAAPNPTLAKEAVEKGIMGSTRNMAVYSARKLDALEAELQREARRRILVLPKKADFVALLDDIEQQFSKGFFSERAKEAGALKAALRYMNGPHARATDMLKVKRFLDGLRTSSSFRLDPNLVPRQEELKIAADVVRAKLHTVPQMSKLIQDERVFIQAFEALVDDAVRTGNKRLLGLTDVLLGGGGVASGFPGAGLGAMAAVRAGQTPRVLTGLGQALYRTGRAVPRSAVSTGARTTAAIAAEAAR